MMVYLPYMICSFVVYIPQKTCEAGGYEGYNIYSESYAKWLLKNHPKEIPTVWITHLNKIEKDIFKWFNLIENFDIYVI